MTTTDLKRYIETTLANGQGTIEQDASDLIDRLEWMVRRAAERLTAKAEEEAERHLNAGADEEKIYRQLRLT